MQQENLQLPHMILRAEDLQPENITSLPLHEMISLILLPFTVPHWSRFYSFEGLISLCKKKESEERK